jgi:hypothetical protein
VLCATANCRYNASPRFGHRDLDAALRQIDCQRRPNRPPPTISTSARIALGAARNRNARKLDANRDGAEGNVVGTMGRQGRDSTLDVRECAAIRRLSSSEVGADSYCEIAHVVRNPEQQPIGESACPKNCPEVAFEEVCCCWMPLAL